MRPISNERPGVLVLEKYSHCGIAWYSDGEMRLLRNDNSQSSHRWHHMSERYTFLFLFKFLHKKVSGMQKL